MKPRFKVIILIIVIWGAFFVIDLVRVKNDKLPIFAFRTASYKDGGSSRYTGLFYTVYSMHYFNPEMNENWENEDGSLKEEYKDQEYIVYKKLVPWFVGIDYLKDKYSDSN